LGFLKGIPELFLCWHKSTNTRLEWVKIGLAPLKPNLLSASLGLVLFRVKTFKKGQHKAKYYLSHNPEGKQIKLFYGWQKEKRRLEYIIRQKMTVYAP
jgi:hypothetical protein